MEDRNSNPTSIVHTLPYPWPTTDGQLETGYRYARFLIIIIIIIFFFLKKKTEGQKEAQNPTKGRQCSPQKKNSIRTLSRAKVSTSPSRARSCQLTAACEWTQGRVSPLFTHFWCPPAAPSGRPKSTPSLCQSSSAANHSRALPCHKATSEPSPNGPLQQAQPGTSPLPAAQRTPATQTHQAHTIAHSTALLELASQPAHPPILIPALSLDPHLPFRLASSIPTPFVTANSPSSERRRYFWD